MERLKILEFLKPLQEYIHQNRPFMGICIGMQALYNSSEESRDVAGLGKEQS